MDKILTTSSSVEFTEPTYTGSLTFEQVNLQTIADYNFKLFDALQNPNDLQISNSNTLILSDRLNVQDVFTNIKEQKTGVDEETGGMIGMNLFTDFLNLSGISLDGSGSAAIVLGYDTNTSSNAANAFNFGSWIRQSNLYFEKSGSNVILTTSSQTADLDESNYFYIQFVNEKYLNIIHNNEELYFLTYDTNTQSLSFTLSSAFNDLDHIKDIFYSLNEDENRFLFFIEDISYLSVSLSGNLVLEPLSSTVTTDFFFEVLDRNSLEDEIKVKQAFFPKYGLGNTIDQIYTQDNFYVWAENYKSNQVKDTNLVTLRNNINEENYYSLQKINNLINYRDYSAINLGPSQEKGYPNIFMNYNTDNYTVEFLSDKITYFNLPTYLGDYERININDTNLFTTGAVGGCDPLNADKMYKRSYEYGDFVNSGNVSTELDNGVYLCSWYFYDPVTPTNSKWLDRYYMPDRVKKLDALSETGYNFIKNVTNPVVKYGSTYAGRYGAYYREFDRTIGVFDVESNLVLEPNFLYAYYHIGKEKSAEKISEYDTEKLLNELTFSDGSNSLNVNNYGESNVLPSENNNFTLSFDIEVPNLNTVKGENIIGNEFISLKYDKRYTPFVKVLDGNKFYNLDSNYNLIYTEHLSGQGQIIVNYNDFESYFVIDDSYITEYAVNGGIINQRTFSTTITSWDWNRNIYMLDNASNYYVFDPINLTITNEGSSPGNLLNYNDGYNVFEGQKIDDNSLNEIIYLNDNALYFSSLSSPLISSNNADIVDFKIGIDDRLYVLTTNTLYNIDYSTANPVVLSSVALTSTYGFTNLSLSRVLEAGFNMNYIDIIDSNAVNFEVQRYTTDFVPVSTITSTIAGSSLNFDYTNSYAFTKTLSAGDLIFNVKLIEINYQEFVDIELPLNIESTFIKPKNTINLVVDNTFGSISLYVNGDLINFYNFDTNKYYFSERLINSRLFIGSSLYDNNNTISDVLSAPIMLNGGYIITNVNVHDRPFNYFDVQNYNRREDYSAFIDIPIKLRGYAEEVIGMYKQNKNVRKSEYSTISINLSGLTEEQKTEINSYVTSEFNDLFVNNSLSSSVVFYD